MFVPVRLEFLVLLLEDFQMITNENYTDTVVRLMKKSDFIPLTFSNFQQQLMKIHYSSFRRPTISSCGYTLKYISPLIIVIISNMISDVQFNKMTSLLSGQRN